MHKNGSLGPIPTTSYRTTHAVRLEPQDTLPRSLQDYRMNSEEQRVHWDLKYEQGLTSLTQPDPFFVSAYGQFVDQSFPNAGVALDLACGLGRHALWLASRNWRVSAVDLSAVAIA